MPAEAAASHRHEGLSLRDREALVTMQRTLGLLRLDGRPALSNVLPILGELVPESFPWVYGLHRDDADRLAVSWAYARTAHSQPYVERFTARAVQLLQYDPLRPAAWQRNRVVGLAGLLHRAPSKQHDGIRAMLRGGYGGAFGAIEDQPRVLICDGPLFLGWFGLLLSHPCTPRELALIRRLVPFLRARLQLEHRWENGRFTERTLEVALEALVAPAGVIDARGGLLVGNSALLEWHARSPTGARRELREALRGATGWSVRPVDRPGCSAMFLVIREQPSRQLQTLALARAAVLTAREAQVLAELARGRSNSLIANALQLSERTVEAHVSEVLRKTGSETRAQLASRVWAAAG
jgi:DNA-binding CsgD family transcriptional regulator